MDMGGDMEAGRRAAKGFLRRVADTLWPPRSLVSGQRGAGSGPLLPSEFAALQLIGGALCDSCGVPMEIDLGPDARCAACIARPPSWSKARAAMVYDDASRRPVLDLKHAGRRDGLATLGLWMANAGAPLLASADLIVPVPLHYTRLASRGYNQSAWLGQQVARQSGVPLLVDALKRTRRTPSQGGLSGRGRHRNVAGAFDVRPRAMKRIRGQRILLIDDVYTTGATLKACTRTLKRAGADDVSILVLARVVRAADVTI